MNHSSIDDFLLEVLQHTTLYCKLRRFLAKTLDYLGEHANADRPQKYRVFPETLYCAKRNDTIYRIVERGDKSGN